jgi:hypothetical protein
MRDEDDLSQLRKGLLWLSFVKSKEGQLGVRCSRSDHPVNVGSRARKRTKRLRLRSARN